MQKISCIIASLLLNITTYAQNQKTLVWEANPPEDKVTHYNIYQSIDTNEFIKLTSITDTTCIVNIYGYITRWKVTALNNNLESLPSNIVSSTNVITTVAPKTPSNLRLINVGYVKNGGFESGTNAWSTTGNVNIRTNVSFAFNGNGAVMFNAGQFIPNGTVSQKLKLPTEKTYILSFRLGIISYNDTSQKMEIILKGKNTVRQSFLITPNGNGNVFYKLYTMEFLTDAELIEMTFQDISESGNITDMYLDDVSIIEK